jgi:phosphate-selective porin OprO and OprP
MNTVDSRSVRAVAIAALCAALTLVHAGVAVAQSPESDPAHGVPDVQDSTSFIPDVPSNILTAANVNTPDFSLKFGLAILLDYTDFSQNKPSLEQVGQQESQFQVRDFRFMARGHAKLLAGFRYQVALQYKGFAQQPGEPDWQVADLNVTFGLGKALGDLTVGKTKQTFGYEMVGDAANLPQEERLTTPFFKTRDIGIKLMNTEFGDRATWSVGWFNDWWISGTDWNLSGQQFTARITALPIWGAGSKRYLHLAVAGRYNGAGNDTLQFRGQPQSNVASYYINTGKLSADHAWEVGFEGLWAQGPFSLLAEYDHAWIQTAQGAQAYGWYVEGSWIVTGGGPRPYDRKVAYARRVPITHRWGEVEIVARYGQVNFNNRDVQGGDLNQWYFAVNWWATRRWKANIGYGSANLKQVGSEGWTGILLTRLQWIF